MKKITLLPLFVATLFLLLLSLPANAQDAGVSHRSAPASPDQASAGTVPVSIVVSVEAKHGKDVPVVNREDVVAIVDKDRAKVTDWVPVQSPQVGLQLFLVIDEGVTQTIGLQFNDLRNFIAELPPTTVVALGYMQYGTVRIAQNFTTDRALLAKALRLPLGYLGADASPYLSVTDLIKRWNPGQQSREMFLVSDGIDPLQPGWVDTYLDESIDAAQRTGIQVYSIYASSAGHFGHTLWRIDIAQSNLSRLTDETGGEAYFQGLETPIDFAPFLSEFADRLNHQYKLTILAKPPKKSGLQRIKLQTEVENAQLVSAGQVYIPAAK